ncbi:MAG TPA: hypothetical protein VGH97_06920 [Thermoanaerobaculia bacterium]|jgi:hypothetical protein
MDPEGGAPRDETDGLPFPDSLCHRCAAPPQYIRTARSTFIRCPILKRYPPQPVVQCEAFVPAAVPEADPSSS